MTGAFKTLIRNGLLATASVAAVALVPSDGQPLADGAGAKVAPATPVSVAVVVPRRSTTWDEFSGRLEAVERVDIRSRVSGALQQVHFREGSLVNAGDLLVTIDPAPYAAEVDRLEAQVTSAQARRDFTNSEMVRGQQLLGSRTLSEREVDQRTNAFKEADANLRAAKAMLQAAQLNLDYTQVRAPVSGRVGRLEITIGNLISAGPGAPILTTLVSVDPIYVSFNADEEVVAKALAALGSEPRSASSIEQIPVDMSTQAANGTWTSGRLQLIDNQVDVHSGTVRARAVFANPNGRLMPGQFAKLRMAQPRREPVLLVSERAIGTDQNKKFVLVVDKDHKTAYREVVLGAMADGMRIVTDGLASGEQVVINGLQRVRPGDLVAPELVAMDGSKTTQSQLSGHASTLAQQ